MYTLYKPCLIELKISEQVLKFFPFSQLNYNYLAVSIDNTIFIILLLFSNLLLDFIM